MTTRRRKPTLTETAIADLARLRDDRHRKRFLSNRPSLMHDAIVEALTDEVRERVRVDVHEAAALADAAVFIAERLGTDEAMGRALRAKANALWFSHEHTAAVDVFEQAARRFAACGNSAELGRTLSGSIQSLVMLGRYEEALDAAERARAIFAAAGDERRLARVDLNAAHAFHRQDRIAEALQLYERAYERLLPYQDVEGLGVALHNMAVCLIVLNDFDRALETYQRARDHCARARMPRLVAMADYNIAYLHFFRGDYGRALELLRTARIDAKEAGDPYHCALCDLDQAEIYLELNLSVEAEEMAQRAQTQFESLGNGYEAARAVGYLAIALGQQGEVFRAVELFADGRARFERERNAIWPSMIDLYQALVLTNAGRYFEARRLAGAALAFFRAADLNRKTILCELLLGRIALRIGEHDTALDHCRRAIAQAEAVEAPVLDYQAYFLRGQIEEAMAAPAAAYASYQGARTRLEALRSVLWGDDLKIAFMRTKLVVYERLIDLCLDRDEAPGRSAREIFGYVEQAKARSLRDQFFERVTPAPSSESGQSELVRQIRTLREELNWYYHRVELEQLGRDDERSPERLEQLQAQLKDREQTFIRILRELPARERESVGLQEEGPITPEALRGVLGPEGALVEYFAIDDRILAAVVTADRLDIVPLTTTSRVRHVLRLLQFQLAKFQYGPEYLSKVNDGLLEATQAHLKELHEELVEPLALDSHRRLVVVPHDLLHAVPFHALFDGDAYLVDRHTVSYAPSGSIYALCRQRAAEALPRGRERALVLGVPDARAPFILDEVREVAGILLEADLRVGPDATSAALREAGRDSRLIHIATHGSFREDSPLFSGVRLGDSFLTLHDLYDLRLNADLVTLSGCGTGLQALGAGDELRGLARGLLAGGARSVLATLWSVNDYSTAAFMRTFYRRLQAGEEGAAAVQAAMAELRETWPHPYYWAPFILIGADRQMGTLQAAIGPK